MKNTIDVSKSRSEILQLRRRSDIFNIFKDYTKLKVNWIWSVSFHFRIPTLYFRFPLIIKHTVDSLAVDINYF